MSEFYNYIAIENPNDSKRFVSSYGIEPANNPTDLASQMYAITQKEGDYALSKIASFHPDRDLLSRGSMSPFHNHSGNGGCDCGGNGYLNANASSGQVAKAEVEKILHKEKDSSKTDLMILGTVLIALALILKSN